jgi:hypothetical protein
MPLAKKSDNFYTINTTQGRYYHSDSYPDIWCPSVTTIIGYKDRGKWAGAGHAGPSAAIGSIVHYKILKTYTNEVLPYPSDPIFGISHEEAQDRIDRCLDMWSEITAPLKIKPLAVESAVYSIHPRYAGRIDMLCKVDGVLTLLDLKTGACYEPDHSMQAAAYVNALKWKPKQSIYVYMDAITNRNPSGKGSIHIYNKYDLEQAYDEFLNAYADFGGFLTPEMISKGT